MASSPTNVDRAHKKVISHEDPRVTPPLRRSGSIFTGYSIGASGLGPGSCSACCPPPVSSSPACAPADRAAGVRPDAYGSLSSSDSGGSDVSGHF
eukprot:623117-Hanusia_phi.AAC.1